MDDIAEYRRRHREAYLKRVGLDQNKSDSNQNDPINVDDDSDSGAAKSTSSCSHRYEDQILDYNSDGFYEDPESSQCKRDRYKDTKNDEDYEASLELAKKLQREFDSLDEVRKPDDSYKECLLSNVNHPSRPDDTSDVDLQRAIAKSLIDM